MESDIQDKIDSFLMNLKREESLNKILESGGNIEYDITKLLLDFIDELDGITPPDLNEVSVIIQDFIIKNT